MELRLGDSRRERGNWKGKKEDRGKDGIRKKWGDFGNRFVEEFFFGLLKSFNQRLLWSQIDFLFTLH